jgi:hypothetical protein
MGEELGSNPEEQMDRYTKLVLTVIAVALSVIAWKDFAAIPAWAQDLPPQRVIICDPEHALRCVSVSENGHFDVRTFPAQ